MEETIYKVGAWITGFGVFCFGWFYSIMEYGFLLGGSLGWFPSLLMAVFAGFLWPVSILVIMVLVGVALK